jgi:hypothetical protein
VQGTGNWSFSDIEKGHPDWIRDKQIRMLLQIGLKKSSSPELAGVPLVMDIAKTDAERQVLSALMGMKALGRPFFVAPEVPADRTEALRAAFMATMRDPQFLEEAKRTLGPLDPVAGAEMQKIIGGVNALPGEIIAKAREAVKVSAGN